MAFDADPAVIPVFSIVAAGKINGYSGRFKFGGCICPTTVERLVTTTAKFLMTDYEGWPTVAEPVRVRAGLAADGPGGAGALTVRVYGINEDWDEDYEDITLAGIIQSDLTTKKFIRQYRTAVLKVGTRGGKNVGPITVETESGLEMTNIPIGKGQTQMLIFSVPKDRCHMGYTLDFSADTGKTVILRVWIRTEADDTVNHSPWRNTYSAEGIAGGTPAFINIPVPVKFPPKCDVVITVEPDLGNATVHVSLGGHQMPS